jgi:hypothetical protein
LYTESLSKVFVLVSIDLGDDNFLVCVLEALGKLVVYGGEALAICASVRGEVELCQEYLRPHHGAKNSTREGVPDLRTTSSKF